MKEHPRSRAVVAPRKAWSRKYSRTWAIKATAAILLLIFLTIFLRGNWPVALLVVGGGVGLWGFLDLRQQRRERTTMLQAVDAMAEEEFQGYAAELLRAQGYIAHTVGRALESRTDLLLTRGKSHFFCRLQRQPWRVGKEVVADTLAAMHAHGCERAIVMANQPFTRLARYFARQNRCVLIDRDGLAGLVAQHRQGHRVLVFHREESARLRRRK